MSENPKQEGAPPLSLQRLTAAFAQMLGGESQAPAGDQPEATADPSAVTPKRIIESVLFVGADSGRARTDEELAGLMRDVTPAEVREAIDELNAEYERDHAPYVIADRAEGRRLQIREELGRVRDKFYGRVKEVRLSPKALEVLAVVAYRQPTTAATVDQLRGVGSGALLTQLVRRGLVRREAPADGEEADRAARYFTTDRFLHFFRLDSLEQLPRAAELDD